MPSVAETTLEMIQLVLPEHANTRGTLYGGVMMNWITTAATMAAMNVARGTVVLGRMDARDFVAPVAIGDLVTLRAQVEYTGRSSLEVGVEVHAENPKLGARRLTTASHLAMVAVDDAGRARPVGAADDASGRGRLDPGPAVLSLPDRHRLDRRPGVLCPDPGGGDRHIQGRAQPRRPQLDGGRRAGPGRAPPAGRAPPHLHGVLDDGAHRRRRAHTRH